MVDDLAFEVESDSLSLLGLKERPRLEFVN